MDHYFEWYGMSENRQMRFAKMKLVGQAKLFWTNTERKIERVGRAPIIDWYEIKERLKEKYLPLSYRQKLFDQWQSLRQGSMFVADYIAKFEEYMMRCDIHEDPLVTLSRFKMGL